MTRKIALTACALIAVAACTKRATTASDNVGYAPSANTGVTAPADTSVPSNTTTTTTTNPSVDANTTAGTTSNTTSSVNDVNNPPAAPIGTGTVTDTTSSSATQVDRSASLPAAKDTDLSATSKPVHTVNESAKTNETRHFGQSNMIQAGHDYLVLAFAKGSDRLSDAAKNSLRSFIAKSAMGDIDQIHVAVWSDKPFKGLDLTKSDQDLVDRRIDSIKSFLKTDLDFTKDIETYSMAEKSNWFARAFNTNDAELKSLFGQQGAPGNVKPEQFKMLKTKGGPMKGLLLIEHKSGDSARNEMRHHDDSVSAASSDSSSLSGHHDVSYGADRRDIGPGAAVNTTEDTNLNAAQSRWDDSETPIAASRPDSSLSTQEHVRNRVDQKDIYVKKAPIDYGTESGMTLPPSSLSPMDRAEREVLEHNRSPGNDSYINPLARDRSLDFLSRGGG